MQTDIKGVSSCAPGHESYEFFYRRGQEFLQYDYRTASGKLFSCVVKSHNMAEPLQEARRLRDERLAQHKEGGDQ